MKKLFKMFQKVIIGLALVFTNACGVKTFFKLNFIVDNEIYATVDTNGNETISMPQDPVKENYTFEGWYWDKDIWKNEFTARSLLDKPLSSNMEVYAHFVDDSYLFGTDILLKGADKVTIDGIGDVFYLTVRNNQLVFKFDDYVMCNPKTIWTLSTELSGNTTITSKTVELSVGDSPLYYIYVTDKDGKHDTYIVLIHRNYMFNVSFNTNGGSSCESQKIEEGFKLESVPTSSRTGYRFGGWDYDFNEPVKSNVIANAQWNANQYEIEFNVNGGDSLPSNKLTVTYDRSFTLPTPTRLGYEFTGWYHGNTRVSNGNWNYTENMTLTAHWSVITYSITYYLNGGSASKISLQNTYTVEDELTIQSPEKTGYEFMGWSTSQSGNGIINRKINKGTTGNLSFYAKWEAKKYTITYDVNGGDQLESNTQIVTYGSSYSLASPTRLGYAFNGWYNGDSRVNNGTWSIDGNMTLTAHWTLLTYQITYHLNGGSTSAQYPNTYTVNDLGKDDFDSILLNDQPTKTGYSFDGLFDDEGFSKPYTSFKNQTWVGDKNVYFKWNPNQYTIAFNVNGGNALESDTMVVTYDAQYTLPVPTKPGYSFVGWYCGSQKYESGKWTLLDNLSLTAIWSIQTYSITYVMNGGTNNVENPHSFNYEDEEISLKEPTKTGYTFLGWTSDVVTEPTKEFLIPHNSTASVVVYANWKVNTYTITFDVNGGDSLTNTSINVEYDSNVTLPTPTRLGYTFEGWYSGLTKYESGVWKTPDNVNLVARWSIIYYSITYHMNGGINNENNPNSYTYDTDTFVLMDPTRKGYSFTGWTANDILTPTKSIRISNHSMGDREYWANWEANDYTITFDVNGGNELTPSTLVVTFDSEYQLVSPTRENYSFVGWYYNGEEVDLSGTWNIDGDIYLVAKWTYGFFENNVNYCYFGKYPQSRVTDETLLAKLNGLTETNELGYYVIDGEEYCKNVASIAYSYHGSYWSYDNISFDDGTKVNNGSTYWFKVEPIKWRRIDNDFSAYSFVSDKILITYKLGNGSGYFTNYPGVKFTNSLASAYLTGDFYNKVFNEEEKSKMLEVDSGKKINIMYDTQAESVFPTKQEKKAYSTDYCKTTNGYHGHYYWLDDNRNNYYEGYRKNYYVSVDGNILNSYLFSEKYENNGLRPLIRIN